MVGDIIREIRRRKGMSGAELGRRLGVSKSMISQWETGKRIPKYQTIIKIAAALNTSPSCIDSRLPV